MNTGRAEPVVIQGWSIYAHPLFLEKVHALMRDVEALKSRDPAGYRKRKASKLLAAITTLAFDTIPEDPTRPEYRQGDTLGKSHRYWFRATFYQQYRLFFRYHEASRIIVYAWVNDESTRRARESRDDAYRVFRKMLARGRPPDDWQQLLAEAEAEHRSLRRWAAPDAQ